MIAHKESEETVVIPMVKAVEIHLGICYNRTHDEQT